MKVVFLIGAAGLAFSMGACDAGAPATAKAPPAAVSASAGVSVDPRDQPIPLVDGKPMWAANRKHTAQENADYQFAKNGKDFGDKTEADYVAQAHAFADSPPTGVASKVRTGPSMVPVRRRRSVMLGCRPLR